MLNTRNILKSVYYSFKEPKLEQGIQARIGFCFHTEHIYKQEVFEALLSFCKEFYTITGASPVCTVMTPPNARIKEGFTLFNLTEDIYCKRVEQLSKYAHIGFHGHFWKDPSFFKNDLYDIKKDNQDYQKEVLIAQFDEQAEWFTKKGISHNNTYAAGWWFMNQDLLNLLAKHQFRYDYSFSKSSHYYNRFSAELMKNNLVNFGEPFYTIVNHHSLLHIQNLIGHTSKFPQDFIRNFNRLTDNNKLIYGVMNAHDYDVALYADILDCVRYLGKQNQVHFLSHQDFINEITGSNLTLKKLMP
jgi:hypothetical protein